jgi:hypothetical protein
MTGSSEELEIFEIFPNTFRPTLNEAGPSFSAQIGDVLLGYVCYKWYLHCPTDFELQDARRYGISQIASDRINPN